MEEFKNLIPEQFRITYDKNSKVFRILDTWHEQVRNLTSFDADVPDNSPAIKIVSLGEVNALVGELKRMGWADKLFEHTELPLRVVNTNKPKTIQELAIEKIASIACLKVEQTDPGVTKEAISSIREITGKV